MNSDSWVFWVGSGLPSDRLFSVVRRVKFKQYRPKTQDLRTRTGRQSGRRRTDRRTRRPPEKSRTVKIDERATNRSCFYRPRKRSTEKRWLTLGYSDILEDLLT